MPAGRRRAGVALAALATAALLSGCSSTPAADAARTRCGGAGVSPLSPAIPADGLICLSTALADGRTATLSVTELTTEGDPVVTTYTTAPDRTVDVLVDSTKDRFGGSGAGISHYVCASASFTAGRVQVSSCGTVSGPRESPSH